VPLDRRCPIPVTVVPRSVSGSCGIPQRSPWSAPFPPPPPPGQTPLCSATSSVIRRSQTPPRRTCPACGFLPSRTGLIAQTPQRPPGSRACCFSTCLGSQTTPGQRPTRESNAGSPCGLPQVLTRSPPGTAFSKLNTQPTDASVYASPAASRRPTQDSRSGWSRFSFPVGLFHPLQHAGLSRRSNTTRHVFPYPRFHASSPAVQPAVSGAVKGAAQSLGARL